MELEKEVWSEKELIDQLGITKPALDRLRREKGFPFVKLGNNNVYLAESTLAFLQKNERTIQTGQNR